jgi:hypothetical protein
MLKKIYIFQKDKDKNKDKEKSLSKSLSKTNIKIKGKEKTNKINLFLLHIILIALLSLQINSQQNIRNLNVKSFFEYNTMCGDKFLAKTFNGEIYITTDQSNNWKKIEILPKIKTIKTFESTKLKGKKQNKKNPKFTFLKNLFILRFLKNENLQNYFKLQIHNENIVFITIKGEIIFSTQCGLDLLKKKTLAENSYFDNDRYVEDFIFHPFDQNKGIIICKEETINIFTSKDQQNSSNILKDIYLIDNFGKIFHKIESQKQGNFNKIYDLIW